ncbi:dpp5 [Acrasis kona]|uniref:Dpp5 n=1 Tax=Acrasis kona TaxID=1008807 RepID=A0AAW2YH50_9EUKA
MITAIKVVCALLLLALFSTCHAQRSFTVQDLHAVKRVSPPSVSPDGQFAAYSVRFWDINTKKTTVHLELVQISDKKVTVLTQPGEGISDSEPVWSPDSKYVAFVSTRSGSSQLWYILKTGGEPVKLTNYPTDDIQNLKWSKVGNLLTFSASVYIDCADDFLQCTADRDAKQAALGTNTGYVFESLYVRHWATFETPGKHSHIIVQPLTVTETTVSVSGAPKDLLSGMKVASPVPPFSGGEQYSISPDGSEVSFTGEVIEKETAWSTGWVTYSVPSSGGAAKVIHSDVVPKGVRTSNPSYSPDGKTIAYLAMDRPGLESDRFHINLYDRTTGQTRVLTDKWDRSISDFTWSTDSKYIVATATDVAIDSLFQINVATSEVTAIIDTGSNTAATVISPNTIILSRTSMNSPSDVWKAEVNFESKSPAQLTQLTDVNGALMAQFKLNAPQKFFALGHGNTKIQGWTIKPFNFEEGKKYPVVYLIHGGPEGSWEDSWSYRWNVQLWANKGYAVVMVNPRGSTGMGQNFTDAVRNDWGGAPFVDLMKGLDYALNTNPWMDKSKTCACGASYGGFMINWIQGQTDRFKCLVNHDGVFDTMAMYYSTEELFFAESEYCAIKDRGCVPWEKPEGFERFNPRNFVKNWKTPMLVIHGGHDYRIPESEGLSTFTALQRRGIPSKLLYFPLESHWVQKPDNGIMWYNEVLGWIDAWINK